jgi:hypothetical protein
MPLPKIELLLNFYCYHLGEDDEDQYDEDLLFGGDVEGGFGSSSDEEELDNSENLENFENLKTDQKDYSHELDTDLDHQFDNQTKPSTRKIANTDSTKSISQNRNAYKLKTSNNSANRESIQDRNNLKLNKTPQTDNKESFKNNFRDRNVSKLRRTAYSTNNRESSFRELDNSKLTETPHQTNIGGSNKTFSKTSQSENKDSFREFSTSKSTKTVHQTNIGGSNKTNFKEKDKIRKEKVPLIQIRISKPALSEEKKRKRTESGKIN